MFRLSALSLMLAPLVVQQRTPPVAITHVTVIDVERGTRLPQRTILIEGNRITAVAPSASARVPKNAQLVDGRGRFLIPGLWDMHAHAVVRWQVAAPLYLANGVLGLREVGSTLTLDSLKAHRAAVNAGRIAGPRFVTAGPLLVGRDDCQIPGASIVVRTAQDARRTVDSLAAAGADLIKVHNCLSREAFFAIARAARSHGLPFAGHLPHVVSVAEGSDSGMGLEHLRGWEGACAADEEAYLRAQRAAYEVGAPDRDTSRAGRAAYLRAISSYTPAKCRAVADILARNGTWVTPTLINSTRFRISRDSALRDARVRYVPTRVAETWRQQLAVVATDSAWIQWQRQRHRLVPLLQRSGVGLLVGTDANLGPAMINVFPGFAVHDELAHLVRAGLTPLEALRAATLNPARYLEATDSLGTVAAGKLADLVLLNADPLADIQNTRRIHAVIANGRLFDRAAIETLLAEVERAAHPEAPEKPSDQLPVRQVSVNGTTIRYVEQGSGVPVVFVHGAISDHRAWELQREAVAKRYRFIAIDQRFFGAAPWPDTGVRISQETAAADLAVFVRELKIEPVLVGVSGGANVVLITAVRYPTVARAVFVHEPGLRSILTDSAERALVSTADANRPERVAVAAGNLIEAARIIVDGNSTAGSFDRLPPALRQMFIDNARTLTVTGPREPAQPITCQQLGRIRVPVTISEGALTAPRHKVMDMAAHRCIPHSKLVRIPNAHHAAPRENPAAFNEALLTFLGQR